MNQYQSQFCTKHSQSSSQCRQISLNFANTQMDTGTTASSPFLPGWGPGQSQGRDSRPPDSRVLVLGDGSRVTAHPYTTVAPNSSSRPPKSGKGCLILCGVLVVAALLGAGLILGLSGRNKDKSPSKDYYPNNVPSNIPNNIPNRNKPEIEVRTMQIVN